MATPKALLARLKKILGAYAKTARPESQAALHDLLVQIERADVLKELGCREKECRLCTWGNPEAKEWQNQCRLWAFAETMEDAAYAGRKGNAPVQREARELLEAIEASPLPERRER